MITLSPELASLRTAHENAFASLETLIARKFPGASIWNWYRACSAIKGECAARNDDQTHDAALAADEEIDVAFERYLTLLHTFYRARDGEHGVLGGRGL